MYLYILWFPSKRNPAITLLEYCRYSVKHSTINQSKRYQLKFWYKNILQNQQCLNFFFYNQPLDDLLLIPTAQENRYQFHCCPISWRTFVWCYVCTGSLISTAILASSLLTDMFFNYSICQKYRARHIFLLHRNSCMWNIWIPRSKQFLLSCLNINRFINSFNFQRQTCLHLLPFEALSYTWQIKRFTDLIIRNRF